MSDSNDQRPNPWPHRFAVVLACATFPLIWIGGLVTTVDAGMAVEDWPTTFGYPLLFYPLVKWLYGPADVFIEHGHRLYASAIGAQSRADEFWADWSERQESLWGDDCAECREEAGRF